MERTDENRENGIAVADMPGDESVFVSSTGSDTEAPVVCPVVRGNRARGAFVRCWKRIRGLFGCQHRMYSRVFTESETVGDVKVKIHYVQCLSGCGQRLLYDWDEMRVKR